MPGVLIVQSFTGGTCKRQRDRQPTYTVVSGKPRVKTTTRNGIDTAGEIGTDKAPIGGTHRLTLGFLVAIDSLLVNVTEVAVYW